MGAISSRINRSTQSFDVNAYIDSLPSNSQATNNEAVIDYQSRTIGQLERQYAAGEISEQQYRQRYGEYSEVIRSMGR